MCDRAFRKKSSKARSKLECRGGNRPCLLQKIVKGTVETGVQRAQSTVPFGKNVKGTVENVEQGSRPTVPFAKKRQRHGRNGGAEGATDRAFCNKSLKARSKWRGGGRNRPCLLEKNAKGTVEIAEHGSRPTVPFVKKRQRHGRNCGGGVAANRAFCKKTPKARSKLRGGGRNRPCLLQKNAKGTVEIAEHESRPTVPFGNKR